ncbi:MAG: hypothetical protein PHH98_04075 [Candidatus Gracilibacteria bacterium]|nr:hypothetical protein [Candidatus Gracilibacteria bacterium]
MNKLKFLVSIILVTFLSTGTIFAEDITTNVSTGTVSTGVISTGTLDITPVVSSGSLDKKTESSYIFYYGQGCTHCAKVEKYLEGVSGYEKLNIVKKEVYFDDKNRQEMLDDGKRLGLEESSIGVPFFVVNDDGKETPIIGDVVIIDYLKTILGEVPENNNKTIVFTILIILAIIIPIFLIKLSNKN